MKIFYVHHAPRDKGNPPSQNDGITELGKKDADLVSLLMEEGKKYVNIKAIYASPFRRCTETAKIINNKIKVPIFEDARFNEFGSIENESWIDCQKRIIAGIKDIVYKYDDNDCVLCVTSGVNITAFISLAYKFKPSQDLPFPMVINCCPICFEINKNSFLAINE